MTDEWWRDDDELLGVLRDALREGAEVPDHVVDAGKGLYTWRSIDAELAALTYDSLTAPAGASTRAERATIRELTFATRDLSIHLQVTGTGLHGQVVPPQPGELTVQIRGRAERTVEIDEQGWFTVSPVPTTSFRFLGRLQSGATMVTNWFQI